MVLERGDRGTLEMDVLPACERGGSCALEPMRAGAMTGEPAPSSARGEGLAEPVVLAGRPETGRMNFSFLTFLAVARYPPLRPLRGA